MPAKRKGKSKGKTKGKVADPFDFPFGTLAPPRRANGGKGRSDAWRAYISGGRRR
jgi:hypothetical protein